MYKGNFTEGDRLELIKGLNRGLIIVLKNVNGFKIQKRPFYNAAKAYVPGAGSEQKRNTTEGTQNDMALYTLYNDNGYKCCAGEVANVY